MLRILEERDFPLQKLHLLASERSEGDFLEFRGKEIPVEKLSADSFVGIDVAFFSAGGECSRDFCPIAVAAGAVCIDNSGAWGTDPDVPLVVPEVNPDEIAGFARKRIIANPNCLSTQMVVALKPLHDYARIRRIVVSTYQSVSGAGQKGIDELRVQTGELLNGRPGDCKVFPHQIAFNCLPHIDAFLESGETLEERKLAEETRKVLGDPDVGVTATAVRVPVFYGAGESINIETERKITIDKARELLTGAPGVELVDRPAAEDYPMPLDAAGQDLVCVGRIREDMTIENGLNLWTCADNIRKGSATNAVQIAEILVGKYL